MVEERNPIVRKAAVAPPKQQPVAIEQASIDELVAGICAMWESNSEGTDMLYSNGPCGDTQNIVRAIARLTPVDVHDAGFGFGHVAALVLIVDPATKARVDPERIRATLGLAPAESRVAAMLAAGATAREIAAVTHRAEGTVRELTKRVHLKLGVSRRADLVRMVLLAGNLL